MGRLVKFALVIVAVAVLGPPLLKLWMRRDMPEEQMFAFNTNLMEPVVNPRPHWSRYRNYIIFDKETHEHFNFIYQVTDYPTKSNSSDTAHSAMAYFKGSERRDGMNHFIPLADLVVENAFDLKFKVKGMEGHPFTHVAEEDGDVIHATAHFTQDHVVSKQDVSWDVRFHRVHGVFGNVDTEEGNNGDLCTLVSTLYGYNSEVSGWLKIGNKTWNFSRTPRFRGYAAGSFGCDLPNGQPPHRYPWSWFWLVVPNEDRSKEISLIAGTGKFQLGMPLGDLYGGILYAAVGNEMVTARKVLLHHESALEATMMATTSDGYLTKYDVEYDNWVTFKDEYGEAPIPLTQIYRIVTKTMNYTMDFRSTLDQYFRACVFLERNLRLRVYSDFRAVGVKVHLTIVSRADGRTVYDGTVDTHNALEYAYEPDMDIELYKCMVSNVCTADALARRTEIRARYMEIAAKSAANDEK